MSFLRDNLIPFFKKRELIFIESMKESEGVYSFLFEKEQDLTWKAGQYGLFTVKHQSVKNATRPFSVASAPAEKHIRFTTHIRENPSDFKKALLELKQGMKMEMRGPVGPFYLKDNAPTLLIAGGIGITPFRSIVKQIEAEGKQDEIPIHLLCMDSKKLQIYKAELDEVASHTSISVTYVDSRNDLHQEIDKFINSYQNDGKYLIAGAKSMVNSISDYLLNHNVSKQNIKKDAFMGY